MTHRFLVPGLALLTLLISSADQAVAQVEAPYQNKEERSVYGDNTGSGTILDATNPMDLINRIQQTTTMQNATPPADAIDEALKAFQQEPSKGSASTP